MNELTLSSRTLPFLPQDIQRPSYDRTIVKPGILHVGVGGFHRSHQAVFVDDLLKQNNAYHWGICGVGLLRGDLKMYQVMKEQDHLYTLVIRHANGHTTPRIVGSIVDYLYAPERPETIIERLAASETRIVTLTITEGGYNFNQITGDFLSDNPDIKHDLDNPLSPKTVFGYLTEALLRRKERGLPPFTIISCDNVQQNGSVARRMMLSFAALRDEELCDWIRENVTFPNSMVDRITPVTTDDDREFIHVKYGINDAWPVICEPFVQWIIEDCFCNSRPPLETVGVQIVPDVLPYEKMKMRLLNGSHQVLAYLGYLAGYTYVHEAAHDLDFKWFIRRFMNEEVTPILDDVPGIDLEAYKESVLDRFSNACIRDRLTRICEYTSDRIPKFLLPTIHENLARGTDVKFGALVVASWCRFAEGLDEESRPIPVIDPMAVELRKNAITSRCVPLSFLTIEPIFGNLVSDERFTEVYKSALLSLYENGARETVRRWIHGYGS